MNQPSFVHKLKRYTCIKSIGVSDEEGELLKNETEISNFFFFF